MPARRPSSNGAGGSAGPLPGWSEADSAGFAGLARIVVPGRSEQIRILVGLIPARRDEGFSAVELGAGQGVLARAVLNRFPRCRYLAYDRSPRMLAALRRTLRGYGPRAAVCGFDLAAAAWRRDLPRPLRCVLASLVVHHLTDAAKRRLFLDVAARLEPGGAFLMADLVAPPNAAAQRLFAAQWDRAAHAQSRRVRLGADALRRFTRGGWNHYAAKNPDPYDRPARLLHQLRWLEEAGLERVDCFWMQAGHAIFGGYRRVRGAAVRGGRRARMRA